ncbi:hypothetical protein OG539_32950 [Actinacidiphila glaucinigra]|uniref:hypothetical protein n=1 Tax=Actinacidiphila glaucinigra TaxID=235986 RepID=UPI00324E1E2F
MAIPEHILNTQCSHGVIYMECVDKDCNAYLRDIEERGIIDNSAEAWEEDWNDSPQLGGMGEELRQLYTEPAWGIDDPEGASSEEPPHMRADRYSAAGDEMAASLVRDGWGDDEIAESYKRLPADGGGSQ